MKDNVGFLTSLVNADSSYTVEKINISVIISQGAKASQREVSVTLVNTF